MKGGKEREVTQAFPVRLKHILSTVVLTGESERAQDGERQTDEWTEREKRCTEAFPVRLKHILSKVMVAGEREST